MNRPLKIPPLLRLRIFCAPILGLGTLVALGGEPAPAPSVHSWPARAEICFDGTSTLHDFGGQLPAQPFLLVLSNGTWSAQATVRSGQMTTAHEKRDKNLHAMMDTNGYPLLLGRVVSAPVPGPTGTNALLALKIRSVETNLVVRITDWAESDTEIRFHAAWEVSLKQFGLKPPSVLGVIRVGDRVQLTADVTASKTNAPSVQP